MLISSHIARYLPFSLSLFPHKYDLYSLSTKPLSAPLSPPLLKSSSSRNCCRRCYPPPFGGKTMLFLGTRSPSSSLRAAKASSSSSSSRLRTNWGFDCVGSFHRLRRRRRAFGRLS